jgi:hypothetical protein
MHMINHGNAGGDHSVKLPPRKTVPKRVWITGMFFVVFFVVADYGFGETGSEEIKRQDASPDARASRFGALQQRRDLGTTRQDRRGIRGL